MNVTANASRRRRPRTAAVFALVAAIAACFLLMGCGQAPEDAVTPPAEGQTNGSVPGSETGSVAFDLELGGTVRIASVAYDISGGSFHTTGSIDVSNSATASTIVEGIPFGTGYVATMSASSSGTPHLDCGGSASFDVAAADVTSVPVHLTCREAPTSPPPPAPVPLPRYAALALSGLLLTLGIALLGRAATHPREARSRCS